MGGAFREETVKRSKRRIDVSRCTKFPTYIRDAHPDHPESPDFATNLGGILGNLAAIDLAARRFEEARVRLREAIEWQRRALASNLANPIFGNTWRTT
jgi:hypothetical protein